MVGRGSNRVESRLGAKGRNTSKSESAIDKLVLLNMNPSELAGQRGQHMVTCVHHYTEKPF